MCGLALILSPRPSRELAPLTQRMLDLLAHRGPDDRQMTLFDPRGEVKPDQPASVALGHLRLAILDLSDAGRQPMPDPTRHWWLVYNGEIYNYLELADELRRDGIELQSHCDSEVLLRLLVRDGPAALPALDGMFAFGLYDAAQRKLLLARDHVGIKPLYFWRAPAPGSELFIASEIKAFTAHPAWTARPRRQRVWDYLVRGIIDHDDQTMFEGVQSFPAGCCAIIDLNDERLTIEPRRWYQPRHEAALSVADPAGECLKLLRQSVDRQLRADVTVGSCLSGGVDSSSIVCLAGALRRQRGENRNGVAGQMTFTARSSDPTQDEWPLASLSAAQAGAVAHEVWSDGSSLLDDLDQLVWIQDEPFGSPSIYLQYRVFQAAAAQRVKVMLDGQGADELFAGYHVFFTVHLVELLRHGRVTELVRWLRDLRRVHGWSMRRALGPVLAALAPRSIRAAAMRRRQLWRWLDHDALQAQPIDPLGDGSELRRGVNGFGLDQLQRASLPMLLHWEDRNSMAHSVEARVPFLAPPLVEFALSLDPQNKLRDGMTKVALREAMRGILPEPVRTRTDKIAFAAPERHWLTGADASQRVTSRLDRAMETCGRHLRPAARSALREIAAGARPYDRLLWRILCLDAWLRRFNVQSTS